MMATVTGLIYPTINFSVFGFCLIYFSRRKIKSYFKTKSESLSSAYYAQVEEEKRVQMELIDSKLKFEKIEKIQEKIDLLTKKEVEFFHSKLQQELEEQLANRTQEIEKMISSERKILYFEFYQQFVEEVFDEAKEEIVNNQLQQQKITHKLLEKMIS